MTGKRSGVLDDHKRVGNRLKSAWLTEFNFQFTSYIDDVLPEISLLGLLNDAHGYARGAELSLALGTALESIGARPAPILSVIGQCSDADLGQVASRLGTDLAHIRVAAAPLLAILPQHPLARLGTEPMDRSDCLDHMKECVGRLYDRNSTPACVAMANLYYSQACNDKIKIAHGLRVPNLEAIITQPDSDDAAHASSTVRMHAQMLVGHLQEEEPTEWASLFWHRCYLATACDVES